MHTLETPAGVVKPVNRKRRRRLHQSRRAVWTARIVVLVLFLVGWDFLRREVVAEFFVGNPWRVWDILVDWVGSGFIFDHIGYTVSATVLGFLIGTAVAVPLAVLLGTNRHLYRVVDPFLNAGYSVPKIAIAPLLIIWFGLGLTPKVVLAAAIAFFLVFHTSVAGVRDVEKDLTDQVYLFGGTRWTVVWRVILPTMVLQILNGLRLSFPYALHGAIIGELIASHNGLGYLLASARGTYNMSAMIAALIVIMIVALTFVALIDLLQRWVPSTR
ncbi:MAG: ABC transporter permease subunit [Actinophytocola sp.]|uniref:ABC transporter permease n=1 Tax=Actinophytocola sp. TaxID=1872138 RepID=UPI0013235C25|nr:ABC transporter permease [Actinophytocola sp.]MPZ79726.1 ABC transporter permease subunit [Actinophytocola sp.]